MKQFVFYLTALFILPVGLHAACLKGDCRNGKGRMESSEGRIYEGEFKDNFFVKKTKSGE